MKNIFYTLFLFIFLITPSQAELKKVSLQLEWKHQFEFAGFYTAKEKGYYKDIGLDVEIKEFHDGINISEDVISGKSTFGISSSALILEKLKEKPVVLIASYFKQNALALVTKPDIKTPSDLKQKKIMALEWEMGHTSLGVLLKDFNITNNDYTLINHDYKIDKFINGEVDAMSIFTTSQPYELDKLGINYNILNPANFGIYSYDVELFTNENMIIENPKMVESFVEATNKGWEYAFKNKEEIVNLIYEKYTKRKTKESLLFEANQTEKIFKTNIFKIGAVAPELIKLNADLYTRLGLVDKNLNLKDLLDTYYFKRDNRNILTSEEKLYLKNNPIIKVQNEDNWPPFNFRINEKEMGYSIDYMNLLASKLGFEVSYVSGFSWSEYIEKLKNNEIDVMLNIAKTPIREKTFNFTTPYIKSIDAVFVRENSENLTSLEDLEGKNLVVIKDFYEEELLKKYYPKINLIFVNNSFEGLKKVVFNEADAFFDNYAVANYFIENNLISNIKPAFEIKDERFNLDLSLATNIDNKILKNILEKGEKLISETEIINLKRKWINRDLDKKTSIDLTQKELNYLKNKKVIKMCVNPDLEPFEKINFSGKHEGIVADLIKIISTKIETPIKLIPTNSWEQSLEYSKEKKCDILSFVNETSKRKEWLSFTKTLFTEPNIIITKNDFPKFSNLSNLENNTIAIVNENSIYEKFEKDFKNLKVIPVKDEKESFSLVQENKVDMAIQSLIISAYIIKKENLFNLKIVSKPSKYENSYKIGVLKEDTLLRDILNKAVNSISESQYDRIINKYTQIEIPKDDKYLQFLIYITIFILLITIGIFLWNYQLRKKIAIEIEKNSLQKDIMFQQNKKAELGNLIANISHQWRDSLTKIGYINLNLRAMILQNKKISKDFLDNSTSEIEKSLDFMSETMQNFLDYYKPSNNIQNFEVYESIKSALSIIDTKIKNSNINIIVDGNFETKITGIKNEWMQVWINLIINSINISIQRDIQDPEVLITIENNKIIFEDNCGKIDDNLLEEINKNNYKGLGIKMAKEIASKNGKIMEISNGKNGAIFKFLKN